MSAGRNLLFRRERENLWAARTWVQEISRSPVSLLFPQNCLPTLHVKKPIFSVEKASSFRIGLNLLKKTV